MTPENENGPGQGTESHNKAEHDGTEHTCDASRLAILQQVHVRTLWAESL